jgi:hypothetical protein
MAAVSNQPVAQFEHQLDTREAGADDRDGRRGNLASNFAHAPIEGDRLQLGINRKRCVGTRHRRPAHPAAGRKDQAVIDEAFTAG